MAEPDSSLGISADFDAAGFRNAIRFAMEMGLNPDPSRRPTFIRKSSSRVYKKNSVVISTPRLDRDGRPLDPEVEVVRPADVEVSVDCAIEVQRADAEELPVGTFRPTKVVATLLDDQYEEVKDCREMLYNGDRYVYGYEPESNGLFDVGVYTIIFYAVEDT